MKLKPLPLIASLLLGWPSQVLASPDANSTSPVQTQSIENKKPERRLAESTMVATIKAPIGYVWDTLVDFGKYPEIFERLKSVNVTKRDGNFVYIESLLKPHLFVRTEVQHTVNDLAGKPEVLKWKLLDGNFRYVEGSWNLKSLSTNSTEVTYRLSVDPGPVIPAHLVSFVLHFVQKEIVNSFAQYTEKTFTSKEKAAL
jgi:ribosome-associated toxin RatA of RatAB toxin-antitoxin module